MGDPGNSRVLITVRCWKNERKGIQSVSLATSNPLTVKEASLGESPVRRVGWGAGGSVLVEGGRTEGLTPGAALCQPCHQAGVGVQGQGHGISETSIPPSLPSSFQLRWRVLE